MTSKIVNKAKHFHKHGKHKSVLMEVRALAKRMCPKPFYHGSVKDLMKKETKK